MQAQVSKLIRVFFQDEHGRVVIWQRPNFPLIAWAVFKVLELTSPRNELKPSFGMLSSACLFAWSVMEVTQGVTYFRRTLGGAVLAAVLVGYFAR